MKRNNPPAVCQYVYSTIADLFDDTNARLCVIMNIFNTRNYLLLVSELVLVIERIILGRFADTRPVNKRTLVGEAAQFFSVPELPSFMSPWYAGGNYVFWSSVKCT